VYYTSDDGGESWTTLSYPAAAGYGVGHLLLRIDGGTEAIYLATWNGVYGHRVTSVDVPLAGGAPWIRLRARPNPFRGGTEILFDLPSRQPVMLTVIDVQGRVVATLLEETLEAGSHRVRWTASGRSSGIYMIRLVAGGRTSSVKALHLP
jgi:hypothetical protein